MNWAFGLIGAVIGGAAAEFGGALAGFAIGWLFAASAKLRTRIDALEKRLASGEPARVAAPVAVAAPVRVAESRSPEPSLAASPESELAPIAARTAAPPAVTTVVAPEPAPAIATPSPELAAAREAMPPPAAPRPIFEPPPPRAPDWFDRLGGMIKRWFTEGNVPVKVGIVVLFFGVAAALKYAVDQGYLSAPIEVRLGVIAAGAIAALVFGWRQRTAKPAFGLSLQGGAIGVLLLTVFAAYRLYSLLPSGIAFGLVVVIVAGAALLAVLQDAVALAVLGFAGGYLAPVLISTGSGNHVALFTYYALLNAAVFFIAWIRPWRALNLVGFVFTFAIGALWGAKYYRAEHFATVEPFLVLFFVFYLAIPVLYALRQPLDRRGFVDGTLVFGMPLLAFPLQAAMLEGDRMGLAYSALIVAAVYALLTWWLLKQAATRLLGQSFALLAVGFATLAVPLALSARWTATTWAIEGVALVWLGLRQQRLLPQATGLLLQLMAAGAFFLSVFEPDFRIDDTHPVLLNGEYLSALLLALAAYATSWLYDRAEGGHAGHRVLVWMTFLAASFWWFVSGAIEIERLDPRIEPVLSLLVFLGASAAIAALLRRPLAWAMLGWPIAAVALSGVVLAAAAEDELGHPFGMGGGVGWLAWFAGVLLGLWVQRDEVRRRVSAAHIGLLATLALVFGFEARELALSTDPPLGEGWFVPAFGVPLALLLFATWRTTFARWPLADAFERHEKLWYALAGGTLALLWFMSLFSNGDPAPLAFVPLLNPLELAQLAVLALLVRLAMVELSLERAALATLAGGAAFVFVTVASLRAVHHLADVPWSESLLDSRVAQAVLSIVWTTIGMAAWIFGSKRRERGVWLAGAVLMAIVLLKLVAVDRQYLGNITGIVAFLAVGGLLVAVGYFAPSPPRERAVEANA